MKYKLTNLLTKPGVRYLLVGGSVYIFELAVIIVAQHQGASAVGAVALSFFLGTIVSFLLQKLVTFNDKRMHHKILIPQLIAMVLLVLFNFGFTLLVTKLLAHVVPAVVSRTLALLTTTVWNFYLYRTKIFKSGAEDIAQNTLQ
jgi:putative flippase GtrA